MRSGREDAHVGPGLGRNHPAHRTPDAGDGADQVAKRSERLDHHLDPGGEFGGIARLRWSMASRYIRARKVMIGEPAINASVSPGACGGVAARQIGQHGWIALSVD